MFFVFNKGSHNKIFLLSILIGTILLLSGKRLPFLFWATVVFLTTTFMYVNRPKFASFTSDQNQFFSKFLKLRFYFLLTILLAPAAALALTIYNPTILLMLEAILYIITVEIKLRFFTVGNTYFLLAEWLSLSDTIKFFGQGSGTSTLGSAYLVSEEVRDSMGLLAVEHGPVKVVLELGILGIIQMFILWLGLFGIGISVHLRARKYYNLMLANFMISLYHLLTFLSFVVGHQYWGDAQQQIYFWIITGLQIYIWKICRARSV